MHALSPCGDNTAFSVGSVDPVAVQVARGAHLAGFTWVKLCKGGRTFRGTRTLKEARTPPSGPRNRHYERMNAVAGRPGG